MVEVKDNYEIITPDGRSYALNYNSVKQLPGVDLAVVQFSSSQNYTVAKIGNSDSSTEGTTAYVAGFPAPTFAINQSIYTFSDGKITANASKPLRDGYALVYSNNTSEGMSGGAVLNEKGELIGVHGRADLDTKEIKTGFNLGIPINTFLQLSAKAGVDVGISAPNTPVATAPKADDFFIQGGDKYKKGDYKGAIADYTKAISLNPKYAAAYSQRGVVLINVVKDEKNAVKDFQKAADLYFEQGKKADGYRSQGVVRAILKDYQGAIAAYTQSIKLNPNDFQAYLNRGTVHAELKELQKAIADFNSALKINPNFAQAYNNRGTVHAELGDNQGAIADYNSALKINSNYAEAYNNRGLARSNLGDQQGAITDYNSALKINPNFAEAYNNRGVTRRELKDLQGAIADFNSALKINSNYADAYNNRGLARSDVGDQQGAIADFNSALKINPNFAYAYNNRGITRAESKDLQGAIADFNSALKINPNYAQAYGSRGLAYALLGDKQRAISDLQKAAELFRQQGRTADYQKTLELIRQIQQ